MNAGLVGLIISSGAFAVICIIFFIVWLFFPFVVRANMKKLQKQLDETNEKLYKISETLAASDKHRREEFEALAEFYNGKGEE